MNSKAMNIFLIISNILSIGLNYHVENYTWAIINGFCAGALLMILIHKFIDDEK